MPISLRPLRRPALALCAAAAVAGLVAVRPAVGNTAAGPQDLNVTATAAGLSDGGVTRLGPGLTEVSFRNADTGEHALHLIRLDNGVSVSRFEAVLSSGDMAALGRLITWYGGVNSVPSGRTWTMSIRLTTGAYVIIDSGQQADGSPNFAHPGFIRSFRVSGEATRTVPPAANVQITQVDFAFDLPATLPRQAVLRVTNSGAQAHEMDFLQLEPGVTPQQALQALAHHQEPPGKEIDVLTALSPGLSAWVPVQLDPGTYLVVSLFPDMTKGGLPQAAEGMVASFTVN